MKVDTQNIPSELYDDYIGSLRPSTQLQTNLFGTFKFGIRKFGIGPNVYIVRRRQPFRLPHMQGLGPNTPSGLQILVRHAFKKCVLCYNNQPYSGGVTPPAIGPRNRSWWYNDAASSGLWYFDYFIQQSWPPFFSVSPPDWCRLLDLEDTFVATGNTWNPNANYSTNTSIRIGKKIDSNGDTIWEAWALIKASASTKTWSMIHLWNYNSSAKIYIYNVNANSYNTSTVTWNTKPALGSLRKTEIWTTLGEWHAISISPGEAICIKIIEHFTPGWPPPWLNDVSCYSQQNPNNQYAARISP